MTRHAFRVHHWTVGQRFKIPVPVGSVLDFALGRDPAENGQIFCVWVEDRGDEVCSLRWSRAQELYATWRRVDLIANLDRLASAPSLHFDAGRVLLTYILGAGATSRGGSCVLHWKRTQGGPWSEGAVVRERVHEAPSEAAFPFEHVLDEATGDDGRIWQLIRTDRFVEPTYALQPKASPERALLRRTPWEDELLYTGIPASAADRAKLIWDRGRWTIVRRAYDERTDGYALEGISLDLSILRHDANEDGQTDVVDTLLSHYDPEHGYCLWAETDLAQLGAEVGTVIAVRQPHLRTGKIDPSAKLVFRVPETLSHVRALPPRAPAPPMELIGRGKQATVQRLRAASSPVPNATPWEQRRPPELTFAVDAIPQQPLEPGWLMPGMVLAESGTFALCSQAEANVEWRTNAPAIQPGASFACLAEVLGYFYSVQLRDLVPLVSSHRHRTNAWVGKLYTHKLRLNLSEAAPLTRGLRIPLLQRGPDQWAVLGILQVTLLY